MSDRHHRTGSGLVAARRTLGDTLRASSPGGRGAVAAAILALAITAIPTAAVAQQSSPYLLELSLADAVRIGAITIRVDYSAAPGGFRGVGTGIDLGGTVECRSPVDGAIAAFFDCEDPLGCPPLIASQLGVSVVFPQGVDGPTPLAECVFDGVAPVASDFQVIVTDAADEMAVILDPPPAVIVSAIAPACTNVPSADCNGNGALDAADPLCSVLCLIGANPAEINCTCGADCNCNGQYDAGDPLCSVLTLVGQIESRSCSPDPAP